MNTIHRNLIILAAVSTALLSSVASAAGKLSPEDRAQLAMQRTADKAALSTDSLSVAQSIKVPLPLQGRNAYAFKVLDKATGKFLHHAVDDDGADVDVESLVSKEEALHESWYGRVDERLLDRLSFSRITDQIPIDIWVNTATAQDAQIEDVDASSAKNAAVAAASERVVTETRAQQVQRVKAAVSPVVNRLTAMGYTVAWNGIVPLIHVTVSPEHLQQIGRWREIGKVYPKVAAKSLGDVYGIARPTVGADVVQGRGITGAVRIGEDEVGGLVYQNPNLSRVYSDSSASLCLIANNPNHSAAVAGILHYMAPGADILATGSCTGNPTQLANGSMSAINWGAAVINNSWGESRVGGADNLLDGNDHAYDYMVINYRRLEVIAAGNDGRTSGNVGSPGSAYNVVTVGNYDDKNTVAWAGDTMYPESSFRNPASTHGDREKPEVAAPGTNFISAMNSYPYWGQVGSGTSYAAPVVTGIAAMMIQRAPALVNWPVATKAILMATAVHNIEGASRLSDKDGAGGVWAPYADDVTRGVNGSWGAQNYSCATPTKAISTMPLVAGKLTRVVIAWNTDPAYAAYSSRPSSDYDLTVSSPTGAVVATSASYDNTYEIVEFTPSVSGSYRINVVKDRCELSPRTLAYAWWRNI